MRDEVEASAHVANRKALGDGGHDAGLAQPLLADGAEDRLFRAEDGVDGPLGHAGLRGHDLDARRRIPTLSEQRSRRLRDRAPRLERASRVVAVENGLPVLEGGRRLHADTVVWCTGFGRDYSWIQFPVAGADGYPRHSGGVADSERGLYFVG